jgi:hypothetical protein
MLLNVGFIAALASAVGPVNLFRMAGASDIPLPLAAGLWIANAIYGGRTASRGDLRGIDHPPGDAPPQRIGVVYVAVSVVAFLASGVFLVLVRG